MTSRPKKELVRVVRAPSGEISIDPVGKKPGRGAYLCPDAACLAKAKKKKALERCFEQPVPRRGIRCTGPAAGRVWKWKRRLTAMAKKHNAPENRP